MFYYLAQYLLAILRDDGVESALIKFMDDTKVGGDASTSKDGIRIQNHLNTLEKWLKLARQNLVTTRTKRYTKKWKIKYTNIKWGIREKVEGVKKKDVRATARPKANMSKAGKSPERQISYSDVLLQECHIQQWIMQLCKALVKTQL